MEAIETQDLSDEQVQQLLRDAEQRIRASSLADAKSLIDPSNISTLFSLDSRYNSNMGAGELWS